MQEGFVIDALAAARLTRLVRRDAITDVARERLVAASYQRRSVHLHPSVASWQDHAVLDRRPPVVVQWLQCPWCVSVWAAVLVTVARRTAPRLWAPVAVTLAAAQVAGWIEAQDG